MNTVPKTSRKTIPPLRVRRGVRGNASAARFGVSTSLALGIPPSPPSKAGGFTLVELLVAVAVFAILAGAAYAALDRMSAAYAAHRDRAEDFQALQMAVARLDMDLRQLTDRPVRTDDGLLPALAGGRFSFEGTRAGWSNPANLPRSSLQRIYWRVEDEQLVRRAWPVTDRVANTPALGGPLLDGVRQFDWRYLDGAGAWQEQWPVAGEQPNALPRAVEYRLELADGREIRRLIPLL